MNQCEPLARGHVAAMGLVIEFFEGYGYDVTIDAREDRRFGLTLRSSPNTLTLKPKLCNVEVFSGMHQVASRTDGLNSVSGPVPKVRYRIPSDQSELFISRIPPTDLPDVGPGRAP